MHLLIPNYKILPARNFQELSEIDTLNFRCQDSLYSTLVLMLSVRSSQDTLQSSSLSSKYGPSRFKNPRWRWLWNSRLQKGNPQTSGWRHSGLTLASDWNILTTIVLPSCLICTFMSVSIRMNCNVSSNLFRSTAIVSETQPVLLFLNL